MAYDGWIEFGGVEVINLARTVELAEALGIDTVWPSSASTEWIKDSLAGADYDVPSNAPWYDPLRPESEEFAGVMPLSIVGLDDSSLESTPVEYVTDGGNTGIARNKTLPIVASVALLATTDRGAEYGLRWLNHVLRQGGSGYQRMHCSGFDLRYFRFLGGPLAPAVVAHRRNTRLTRGTSVTRKRRTNCSVTWMVTFTWTAADPYEYGEPVPVVVDMGDALSPPAGGGVVALSQVSCPRFDYDPIYDPQFPALITPPTAPDFFPSGWDDPVGRTFDRVWVNVSNSPSSPPGLLGVVPVLELSTDVDARMVRFSVWPEGTDPSAMCDPLWQAVVTYLPANETLYIDGEQQACYIWDGSSPEVRRADSLVFGPDAAPVEWSSFSTWGSLLVTLDVFTDGPTPEGDGTVRASLSWVPKSD